MLKTYRYEEIAGELRSQIQRGDFDGERLPSERTLMERFGVQRDTIRRALALLAEEGRIVIEGRRGAFVAPEASASTTVADTAHTPVPKTGSGTILAIAAWNEASTSVESILRGVSHSLEGSGHNLLYFDARPRPGQSTHVLPDEEYLRTNQVLAAALWPYSPADLPALQRLRDNVPLVLLDRRISGFETDFVGFDNVGGARAATEHLLSLGHRRIGFLGDEVFAETVQLRWRGYALAIEAAGMAHDPACIALYNGICDPPFTANLRAFLDAAGRPLTAVVCSNDSTASYLLHALRQQNIRVPGDLAVTGFGDILPHSNGALGLTTVSQRFEEVGKAAGKLMLSRLDGSLPGERIARYQQIELPVQLIVRASSGPPT